MRFDAAPMSRSILLVTALTCGLTALFFLGAVVVPGLLVPGLGILLVIVLSFLLAPVRYEISGETLIVSSQLRSRQFGAIIRCGPVPPGYGWGMRLWGNGGLFAASGLFWSRVLGRYYAYVTSAGRQDLVLVETETEIILVSPKDPGRFLAACPARAPSRPDSDSASQDPRR